MEIIRSFLFSILILINCINNSSGQKVESGLFLEAFNRGIYGSISSDDNSCHNLIEIKLVNKTDTTCSFMAFSCATAGNVIIDPKEILISSIKCSLNYPIKIQINPKQEFSVFIITQANEGEQLNSVRFGLILFPPDIFKPDTFYNEINVMKKNHENVIWSEPISLYGGVPFDIR